MKSGVQADRRAICPLRNLRTVRRREEAMEQFVGIIAEYNPFHTGHALQLRQLRRRGAQKIAVCMSAGGVQRGGVPVLPEPVRVRAALQGGADLVVALPVPYANASAELFAAAGVHLLAALGCHTLAFGAETPDADALMRAADALNSAAFPAELRRALDGGLPFAAARARAAEQLCPGAATLLSSPNNILGVEYCKAIQHQGAALTPLALPRLGAQHGAALTGQAQGRPVASASRLRELIRDGGLDAALPFVPPQAAALYAQAAQAGQLLDPDKLSTAVLAILRGKTRAELAAVRGAGEGLENRLYRAVRDAQDLDDLYARMKTRRYPTARLRRLVLDAVLEVPAAGLAPLPPFLLILGARRNALSTLKNAALPVSTSMADFAHGTREMRTVADLHSRAVDFSSLCRMKTGPTGLAYTAQVVLL